MKTLLLSVATIVNVAFGNPTIDETTEYQAYLQERSAYMKSYIRFQPWFEEELKNDFVLAFYCAEELHKSVYDMTLAEYYYYLDVFMGNDLYIEMYDMLYHE